MSVFSGSYLTEDVQVLLKPIEIDSTPVAEKEYLIQVEKKHYSEMITKESLPSPQYLQLFHTIFAQNHQRLAVDLITLALKICQQKPDKIVLISLARAGTPIGVLLKRILQQHFKRECQHYTISIIRDRGIDENALKHILECHPEQKSFTFIDGWTGKGVIAQELDKSITEFNQAHQTHINSDLYVLNDIAGVAAVTASFDDYLIPSSLLNSTVSGLISRSILNQEHIGAADFHGCVYYDEFLEHDLSRWFIDETMQSVVNEIIATKKAFESEQNQKEKQRVNQQSLEFIAQIKQKFKIKNVNLIKPGIGEATRVLLRRVPDLLILKQIAANETTHLVMLAQEKNITIIEEASMPYQAVAIIQELSHD